MKYVVEFRLAVLESVKLFLQTDLVKIKKKIEYLSANLPDSATTKMKGNNTFHKISSDEYRIICEINDDKLVVLIVKIGKRKDVYKKLP